MVRGGGKRGFRGDVKNFECRVDWLDGRERKRPSLGDRRSVWIVWRNPPVSRQLWRMCAWAGVISEILIRVEKGLALFVIFPGRSDEFVDEAVAGFRVAKPGCSEVGQ